MLLIWGVGVYMTQITRILTLFYPQCQSNKYELMFQDLANGSTLCQFCVLTLPTTGPISPSPSGNSIVLCIIKHVLTSPKALGTWGTRPWSNSFLPVLGTVSGTMRHSVIVC